MYREPMATTHVLLVRHGQTELNHNDAFCGSTEAALTAVGREQAQRLAKRLSHEHIDALYCSPQGRAQETAAPIASMLGLETQTREPLREMNFGLWEGRAQSEIAVDSPQEMAAWDRGSWMVQMPEGETQQAVIARVIPCIIELVTAHMGQTILLVSHRTTLRLLIGHLLNMSLPNSRGLSLDPASLSKLLVMSDQAQLVLFNDTSHLMK